METTRRLGKTTRLMEKAIAYAREGKVVYVLGANYRQIDQLQAYCLTLCGGKKVAQSVLLDPVGRITFDIPQEGFWDWEAWRLVGVSKDVPILVDHFPIELKLARLRALVSNLEKRLDE